MNKLLLVLVTSVLITFVNAAGVCSYMPDAFQLSGMNLMHFLPTPFLTCFIFVLSQVASCVLAFLHHFKHELLKNVDFKLMEVNFLRMILLGTFDPTVLASGSQTEYSSFVVLV